MSDYCTCGQQPPGHTAQVAAPPGQDCLPHAVFLVGRRKDGPPAPGTWCSKARKSLFLRREAPRPSARLALRRLGRGAPRPGNPYSFVERHHVPRLGRPFGAPDVVPHGPEIIIPSSRGTTSLSPSGPAAPRTWCSMVRKSLFLRREAPRPSARLALRRPGRGAPRPANPYSFVGRYHAVCLGPLASHLFNLFIHLSS